MRPSVHERHDELLEWSACAGGAFDPERFDPGKVRFSDPKARWRKAFGKKARRTR